MGNGRHDFRIKGFSDERMERLMRFTRSLNVELARIGGEPLDMLEVHEAYQGLIDDHEGTWADLARRLAAQRTMAAYVEDDERSDDEPAPFEDGEGEPPRTHSRGLGSGPHRLRRAPRAARSAPSRRASRLLPPRLPAEDQGQR